jgi:hypothetical protein
MMTAAEAAARSAEIETSRQTLPRINAELTSALAGRPGWQVRRNDWAWLAYYECPTSGNSASVQWQTDEDLWLWRVYGQRELGGVDLDGLLYRDLRESIQTAEQQAAIL